MSIVAVVLAAGQGTRMKSDLPKVLHCTGGETLLGHVLAALCEAGVEKTIVVLGHEAEMVRRKLPAGVITVVQEEQLGTGHALLQCLEYFGAGDNPVLVACGDTPLIRGETLRKLSELHINDGNEVTILSAEAEDPFGYGRIIRAADGAVQAIVEEKDATAEEKKVREINTGTYCFREGFLSEYLPLLENDNKQGEYYLTDLVERARGIAGRVGALVLEDETEGMGVNDRVQLAEAGKVLRERKNRLLMEAGVTLIDPSAVYIENGVTIGRDTVIYPGAILEGETAIGPGCLIGKNCRIVDSTVGRGTEMWDATILSSEVGADCQIGPYAYLRPGSLLADGVKIGDFVEIKNSEIGPGSKIPHLSYIGDSTVGAAANIGCGTITCNYDGQNKYRTTIGAGAFVGSNTNLVAPVEIGERAVIGAGSTITKDVPAGNLAVARGKQKNYKRKISEIQEEEDEQK